MNRPIKFRAWDGKSMHEDILPWSWDAVLETSIWLCLESRPDARFEVHAKMSDIRWEIMQFTGLTDKNGKDIYEGDVVITATGYGGDHFYQSQVAVVKYDAPEFILYNLNDKDGIVWQDNPFYNIEVIGNVFQNPELLISQN